MLRVLVFKGFLSALVFFRLLDAASSLIALPKTGQRCQGLSFAFSRLTTVTSTSVDQGESESTTFFRVTEVSNVKSATDGGAESECFVQRFRLEETLMGVPIYGANRVATLDGCMPGIRSTESDDTTATIELIESGRLPDVSFQEVTGKSFLDVQVKEKEYYQPTHSQEEIIHFLSKEFGILEAEDKIGEPELYIFPSEDGDYLAYFVSLVVTPKNDQDVSKVIRVVVDAHDLAVLRICILSSSPESREQRRMLRKSDSGRDLQSLCAQCATDQSLQSIGSITATQQINSLYLSDAGKNAIVTPATLTDGTTINTPYRVDAQHWLGTYHCFSNGAGSSCSLTELPTTCADALSDVHYVGVETLKYMQSNLNVLGGLKKSATSPEPVKAYVHVDPTMCNAYYWNNEVAFGDCDCAFWSPLVALDVVAHELGHGFTEKSSNLEYSNESGGLNEGYSDILGAMIEFHINDVIDTPDFLVGEVMQGSGGVLRYMENPPEDGTSIGSVCDFYDGLDVHYSSGVPNKAYVKAVRACANNACSATLSECALVMGDLFWYANLNKLTTFSNYLNAAQEICVSANEFVVQHSPATSCTADDLKEFVVDGWSSVSVTINGATCTAVEDCGGATQPPVTDPSVGCLSSTTIVVPSTTTGSTVGETVFDSVACGSANGQDSAGVWYKFTGTGDMIEASLCDGVDADTQISVWTGSCGSLACVTGNDDQCSLRSRVVIDSVFAQEYYIYIYGYSGATFQYELALSSMESTPSPTPAPAAGQATPEAGCSSSTSIAVPSITIDSTIGQQVFTYDKDNCGTASGVDSAGIWYNVVGTGLQITASSCGSFTDYDSQLSVWTGDCSMLACVDGNDDFCGLRSSVTWDSTFGQTYYVFVYGFAGFTGNFELLLESNTPQPSPAPVTAPPTSTMEEGCTGAAPLSVPDTVSGTTVGETTFQTSQCAGAYTSRSPGKWYTIQGTGDTLFASLCENTDFDTMLSVWEGDCNDLVCVTGSDDFCSLKSASIFSTTPGTKYSIFVHGYGGEIGDFELAISRYVQPSSAPSQFPTTISAPSQFPTTMSPTTGPTCCQLLLSGFQKLIGLFWD